MGILRLGTQGNLWAAAAERAHRSFRDCFDAFDFSGGLAAIHRYFGRDLRVGAGYNFTDFPDDLTDLDYDHRGAFVNVIGTM